MRCLLARDRINPGSPHITSIAQSRRRHTLRQTFRQLTHAGSSEILEGWVNHPRSWSRASAVELLPARGGVRSNSAY
jgi:hypothetical protein